MSEIDDQFIGLSQHAAELKKWDLPKRQGGYRPDTPQPYPRMLYKAFYDLNDRGIKQATSEGPRSWKIANNESEELLLKGHGWSSSRRAAFDLLEHEQMAIGEAAAERAASDKKMSESAQREVAAAEEAHSGHMPEMKAKPILKRKPGRPKRIQPAVVTE